MIFLEKEQSNYIKWYDARKKVGERPLLSQITDLSKRYEGWSSNKINRNNQMEVFVKSVLRQNSKWSRKHDFRDEGKAREQFGQVRMGSVEGDSTPNASTRLNPLSGKPKYKLRDWLGVGGAGEAESTGVEAAGVIVREDEESSHSTMLKAELSESWHDSSFTLKKYSEISREDQA